MFYKVKKDSKTGVKLTKVLARRDKVRNNIELFLAPYGTTEFVVPSYCYMGISGLVFNERPEDKVWKVEELRGKFLCRPKKNTKRGLAIQAELEACGTVSMHELNKCVNWDGYPFSNIGFAFATHIDHYGIELADNWEVKVPKDCIEITVTEYRKLFGSNGSN